jgi:acyl-homoserine lactone acylase PvdQ
MKLRPGVARRVALLLLLFAPPLALAERITIHRDNLGVPHIFAESEEGAVFALGFVQAEDRLEAILRNYRRAAGTLAEVAGESAFEGDVRRRRHAHAAVARARFGELSSKARALCAAYQDGVRLYMSAHPERTPAWAPALEPWQVVALGRDLVFAEIDRQAAAELRAAGLEAPEPEPWAGGHWLLAPARSASGAAIAAIDPHFELESDWRPYEARLYGGELAFAGSGVVGFPLLLFGHNAYVSMSFVPGGADAVDPIEHPLDADDPTRYQDGTEWRSIQISREEIGVMAGGLVEMRRVEFRSTHRGPIVVENPRRVVSLATPYVDRVASIEQVYAMNKARNLEQMRSALAMFQLPPGDAMAASIHGDIFYARLGAIPARGEAVDPSRPIPGGPDSEWRGLHSLDEMIQVRNPPFGYMQSLGSGPADLARAALARPEAFAPYLFGGAIAPAPQPAQIALETLDAAQAMTEADAIELAMSVRVFGAAAWQRRLEEAWDRLRVDINEDSDATALRAEILGWDGLASADSTGATAYYYWKDSLPPDALAADPTAGRPPASLSDTQVVMALRRAARRMRRDLGRFAVPYGEIHRVGRSASAESVAVGGGDPGAGLATPRALVFGEPVEGRRTARFGQSATMVVLMTNPPQSWSYAPLGQSDDPASPHFDDQARLLFAPRRMKSSFFLDPEALAPFIESTTVLEY